MADISAEIAAFQSAVYGEEVRGSMISAIEKINDVAEDAVDTVDDFSDGFQNAVNSCSDAADAANTAASEADAAAATANTSASAATSAAETANTAASDATAQANAASQLNTTVQQAEAARRTAESARVTAENSRVAAETARAGSESNRNNAEATRQENETNRNTAEVARVSAEATRQANESSRQTAETLRTGAEQSRASAFSAMQQSFAEMEQQVLPPATYSTLGGVIVDANSGLEVASDGTLSFEAGDFETATHAAATYATIETVNGKANAQHNHSATDINNGTLAVARGGTGVTTAAAERERLGLGSTTDALPVANGGTGATTPYTALTNLGAGALATLDVVPVANGGTGATTAAAARTSLEVPGLYLQNKFDHTQIVKSPDNDSTLNNNGISADTYIYWGVTDKNDKYTAFFGTHAVTDGTICTEIGARRVVSGSNATHTMALNVDVNGNKTVSIAKEAWRDALGMSSWTTVSQSNFITLNSGWSAVSFYCRYNVALKRVLLQITLSYNAALTQGNKSVGTIKSGYRPPIRATVGSTAVDLSGPLYIDNNGGVTAPVQGSASAGQYFYYAGEYSIA